MSLRNNANLFSYDHLMSHLVYNFYVGKIAIQLLNHVSTTIDPNGANLL